MLKDVGFELTILLGAAGIAGIAIRFVAQTMLDEWCHVLVPYNYMDNKKDYK
jgi:hypothetical protein